MALKEVRTFLLNLIHATRNLENTDEQLVEAQDDLIRYLNTGKSEIGDERFARLVLPSTPLAPALQSRPAQLAILASIPPRDQILGWAKELLEKVEIELAEISRDQNFAIGVTAAALAFGSCVIGVLQLLHDK